MKEASHEIWERIKKEKDKKNISDKDFEIELGKKGQQNSLNFLVFYRSFRLFFEMFKHDFSRSVP